MDKCVSNTRDIKNTRHMLASIPVIGRLRVRDYARLALAFAILVLEPLFRFLFNFIPIRHLLEAIQSRLLRPASVAKSEPGTKKIERMLHGFKNTKEFVEFWGFPFEEHFVTTRDGYILALHRIPLARLPDSETSPTSPASKFSQQQTRNTKRRPTVLLWHGFLMCSEVWVCLPDPKMSLAFTLAQAGYDVWLGKSLIQSKNNTCQVMMVSRISLNLNKGNSRGNKYSCKHRQHKPWEERFWDFCIDDFAAFDVPDTVDYILQVTGTASLSYIGFSQGTGQCFAALSTNAELNKKITLFVALAPVTKPVGMSKCPMCLKMPFSLYIIDSLEQKRSG